MPLVKENEDESENGDDTGDDDDDGDEDDDGDDDDDDDDDIFCRFLNCSLKSNARFILQRFRMNLMYPTLL
ncbi:hypothetical protein PoB_004176600 [Plakobranchus ocellatus]|uniref:Uncharacterized protein n=1 Tax=Plakobranchus ocellatus TaxID=259542 RepID=A0AAV4B476_9GAST|nr:hypothetical protein PoB_004176600 [Plakobranchus ocellatus]